MAILKSRMMLLRFGLPALGGLAAGMLLPGTRTHLSVATPVNHPARVNAESPLPDDPIVIRLAALAGRTTEARVKVSELLAAGAKDAEIAEWLAPILAADPAWLDTFILTVPDDRRIDLVRATFWKIGDLHPDAAWELLRSSPFGRMAARAKGSDERYQGLEILGGCYTSPLKTDVLFDPALGFSDGEITKSLRFNIGGIHNAMRILDEWVGGRWTEDPPECVRNAWGLANWKDKDALREIEGKVPDALRMYSDHFKTLQHLDEVSNEGAPEAEDLRQLGPHELREFLHNQADAGTPVSLDTLAKLSPELRQPALEYYFDSYFPFQPEKVAQCIGTLDQINLTPAEKQTLIANAATQTWNGQGDYQTALTWAALMPDAKARAEFELDLLTKLAQQDPQAALEQAATMPAGEPRETIEHVAKEALP